LIKLTFLLVIYLRKTKLYGILLFIASGYFFSFILNVNLTNFGQVPQKFLNNGNIYSNSKNNLLPVVIFYDDNYSAPWISYSKELADFLNTSFNNFGIKSNILDDIHLLNFLENNSKGILIVSMGILPYFIWNGSENSLIEKWLDNGGIILWTGCEEFYWISYPNGTNKEYGHNGGQKVLDMNYIITRSDQLVIPTTLGKYYIPKLFSHTNDIFTSISLLESNSIYYELYCQNGDLADPILFQPKNGRGYFIRVHADWIDTLNFTTIGNWIYSLVINRFFSTPFITNFNYNSQILLFNSLFYNLTISNYCDSNFSYRINFISQFFENDELTGVLYKYELNRKIDGNIKCQYNALPKKTYLIVKIYINKSFNGSDLQIYFRNLSIIINKPYSFKFNCPKITVYPGENIVMNVNYNNYYNYSINITILIFSSDRIYETYKLINITPGENNFSLKLTMSWTSPPGNASVSIIIYYFSNILGIYSLNLIVNPFYMNPFYLLLLILLIIILTLIFTIGYIILNKSKRIEKLIYKLLNSNKTIKITEFCKKNNITFKKFDNTIRKLVNNDNNLRYIIAKNNSTLVILDKIRFQNWLKKYIKENSNLTYSKLQNIIYLPDNELKNILKNLINEMDKENE